MPTAQNITASALNNVQVRLEEMFAGVTPAKMPKVEHIGAAKAMLENNSANAVQTLRNEQGECIGVELKWIEQGTDAITYSGTGSGLDLACDLGTGSGLETASQTYSNNLVIYDLQVVKDNECSNLITFQQLSAEALERGMRKCRAALNSQMITFLDASKSAVNNDADVTSGNVDGVTFASSTFSVSPTVLPFNDPDTLTALDVIVANNSMDTAFWLAGRNAFYNATLNSQFHRLNDNERYLVRFDDYNMWFDPKNLDYTLTGSNLFAISPGSYIFWNSDVYNTMQWQQIKADMWVSTIPDPVLQYNDNGTMRPVLYNVVYQLACSDRNNSTLKHQMNHTYEIRMQGGLAKAPASEDGHTGILKFLAA